MQIRPHFAGVKLVSPEDARRQAGPDAFSPKKPGTEPGKDVFIHTPEGKVPLFTNDAAGEDATMMRDYEESMQKLQKSVKTFRGVLESVLNIEKLFKDNELVDLLAQNPIKHAQQKAEKEAFDVKLKGLLARFTKIDKSMSSKYEQKVLKGATALQNSEKGDTFRLLMARSTAELEIAAMALTSINLSGVDEFAKGLISEEKRKLPFER